MTAMRMHSLLLSFHAMNDDMMTGVGGEEPTLRLGRSGGALLSMINMFDRFFSNDTTTFKSVFDLRSPHGASSLKLGAAISLRECVARWSVGSFCHSLPRAQLLRGA